ncbi:MAG: hypothetical protein U1F11_05605 [Steroidobacteraceae bacterium]
MTSIFRLYLDIALLRRGPQDVPVSQPLMLATLLAFVLLNALLTAAFRPQNDDWVLQLAVSVAFTLAWYWMLMLLFGRPERWLQTITAILGFGCVVTPVIVPAAGIAAPYAANPGTAMPWMLLLLPVAVYLIYVNSRILQAAIERPMFQCVMLVLLQTFLEPLIILSLFGPDAPPAAAS